jgi:hypothetical protein
MTDWIEDKGRMVGLAVALLAGALVLGLSFSAIPAESKKSNVIGPTKDPAKPTCPTPKSKDFPNYKACNAFGRVTGFQLRTNKQRAVHKIRKNGHIVAWGLDLGNPGNGSAARDFFEAELKDDTFGRYGGNPVANISILKKKRGSKRNDRFTLSKQSPIVELNSQLGQKPIFTLNKPLRVRKGRIVALSTPTWVTNFALQKRGAKAPLSANNKWRGSRNPKRCEGEDLNGDGDFRDPGELDNLTKRSKPQYKKGSTRTYGCIYKNAQILYWAYFVPSKSGKG